MNGRFDDSPCVGYLRHLVLHGSAASVHRVLDMPAAFAFAARPWTSSIGRPRRGGGPPSMSTDADGTTIGFGARRRASAPVAMQSRLAAPKLKLATRGADASTSTPGSIGGSSGRSVSVRSPSRSKRPARPNLAVSLASDGSSGHEEEGSRSSKASDPSAGGVGSAAACRTMSDEPVEKTSKAKKTAACRACGGSGAVTCKACAGAGTLAAGGFHAKNQVNLKNVVGTNWTAHRRTKGWRHFEAIGKSPADKANGKPDALVHLAATCDRDVTVWVPAKELKNRELWSAGWKQREDLDWSGDPNSPQGAIARPKATTPCVVCDGEGAVPCARKGCMHGLERVRRQKEIIATAEKQFKRVLQATKVRAEEDDGVRDMRRRMKRQLKDMSKAETEGKGRRRNKGDKKKKSTTNKNGDEDWGAYGRARRDAKLDKWMHGDAVKDDPEKNQ